MLLLIPVGQNRDLGHVSKSFHSGLGVREGPPRALAVNEVGVEEVVQAPVRPSGGVDPDTREELAQPQPALTLKR